MIERIAVTCSGPPDDHHLRRVLRRYERVSPGEWYLEAPTDRTLLDAGDQPVHGTAIRLHCQDCRLDIKRRLDQPHERDYPPFSEVFERLREAGVTEIDARSLDRITR